MIPFDLEKRHIPTMGSSHDVNVLASALAGLSDQEVAAISGHKSMQMLKRYTHLRAEDWVGKLDKLRT